MMVHSQQVINWNNCTVTGHAEGVSSHLGLVTLDSAGSVFDTVAHGIITAANGDLIYWDWEVGPHPVIITGGTGRFEGASGEFVMDVQLVDFDDTTDIWTYTYIWTASGTITY